MTRRGKVSLGEVSLGTVGQDEEWRGKALCTQVGSGRVRKGVAWILKFHIGADEE